LFQIRDPRITLPVSEPDAICAPTVLARVVVTVAVEVDDQAVAGQVLKLESGLVVVARDETLVIVVGCTNSRSSQNWPRFREL
jgi:hypothetical protein